MAVIFSLVGKSSRYWARRAPAIALLLATEAPRVAPLPSQIPGTPPFPCICTPGFYYDRNLLNQANFWLS